MCPLPVLLSVIPAATDRKGAGGVRLAEWSACRGTLDSLVFASAKQSEAEQKAARNFLEFLNSKKRKVIGLPVFFYTAIINIVFFLQILLPGTVIVVAVKALF